MEPNKVIERLIGGRGNSILRAAAATILASMPCISANEEDSIAKTIAELAIESGVDKDFVAAMLVYGMVANYQQKMGATVEVTSTGTSTGSC